MRKPDQNRHLQAAAALAARHGQRWGALTADQQATYLADAGAVIVALNAYDSHKHGQAVIKGVAASKRAGKPGRPKIPKHKEQAARQMIQNGESNAKIRAETQLGMSSITRIRQDLEKAGVLNSTSRAGPRSTVRL